MLASLGAHGNRELVVRQDQRAPVEQGRATVSAPTPGQMRGVEPQSTDMWKAVGGGCVPSRFSTANEPRKRCCPSRQSPPDRKGKCRGGRGKRRNGGGGGEGPCPPQWSVVLLCLSSVCCFFPLLFSRGWLGSRRRAAPLWQQGTAGPAAAIIHSGRYAAG